MTLLCAYCGAERPLAARLTGGPPPYNPRPGDAVLCISCGAWNVLDDDMQLRKPTALAAAKIEADPNCQLARKAWEQAMRKGSRHDH